MTNMIPFLFMSEIGEYMVALSVGGMGIYRHVRRVESRVIVKMYFVESMASYRLPTGTASYDVGIRYNDPLKEHMLSLHDNNEKNLYSKTNLYLNKEGRCEYKIYFRNNTCLRSEILIFVNHYGVHDKHLRTPSSHNIVYPDNPVYVGKANSLEKSYLFEPNYMWDENVEVDLNSHVVVFVYPEKEDMLWDHRFGYVRSNKHYVYKFKLRSCLDLKNQGYFTKSC